MSLYRKYRPQTFSHLVGQEHINRTLLNALKLDRVSHAYLFTGPRGTGKTSTARLMAKAINCLNPKDNEPCNTCEICLEINEGRLIDLIEIDAASNRGIDEIRELRDKINFAPSRARSKVYIIDEVHMLTKEAFNAILKTLEEPPSHVYFILATTEAHKIPETILSRCQRFDFKRIDDSVLSARLKYIAGEEGIEAEEKALDLISHHAEGGMRDGIGLLEQLSTDKKLTYDHVCEVLGVSGIASMEKLFGFLRAGDTATALKEIADLHKEGFDLLFFNKRFLEYLRKAMLKAVDANDIAETNRILILIENFRTAYEQTRFSTITQLPLEIAVIKSIAVSGGRNGAEINNEAVQTVKVPENVAKPFNEVTPVAMEKTAKPFNEVTPITVGKTVEPVNEVTSVPPIAPEEAVTEPPQPAIPEDRVHQKIVTNADVSIETIKKNWSEIIKTISSPVAKRCIQQGVPSRIEGTTLVATFANKFNMEKLMEVANRTEAEKAIQEVTGAHLKLSGEFCERAAEEDKAEKEFEDKIMDIFEGRVV